MIDLGESSPQPWLRMNKPIENVIERAERLVRESAEQVAHQREAVSRMVHGSEDHEAAQQLLAGLEDELRRRWDLLTLLRIFG